MSQEKTKNQKEDKKGLFGNLNIFNKTKETDMDKESVQNAIKETLESPSFMNALATGITTAVNAEVGKQTDVVNQLVEHTNNVTDAVNQIHEAVSDIQAKLKIDGDAKNEKKLPSNMKELKVDKPVASTTTTTVAEGDDKVIDMSGFSEFFKNPQGTTVHNIKKSQKQA